MEQTDTIEHAGMRGISPETQELIPFNTEGKQDGPPRQSPAYPRVLKALQNMCMVMEAAGATVGDCIRLVV
ncbi:hypothetical protein LTR40_012135 [Exophiala xenobiotica]|nr:hypothetical protein LTR40_012135 [Exophiala xenobiotica]